MNVRISIAVLTLLACMPGASLASNPNFTQNCVSVDMANTIAVGDFNRDGKLDFAINPGPADCPSIAFCATGFVDIYLGNGDGTFAPAVRHSVVEDPDYLDLATTDLNKDGKLDLVTSAGWTALGNGDGTFQGTVVNSPVSQLGLAVGDMNGDGYPDVATALESSGNLKRKFMLVRLNRGDGTLAAGEQYRSGGDLRALTSGDFDGDGLLDIVGLYQSSSTTLGGMSIWLGKGDGKFKDHVDTAIPGNVGQTLAPADFNADGKLDLAVPMRAGGGVLVFAGHGDGTFDPPITYPPDIRTIHVAVDDVDGDGHLDIIAGNFRSSFPDPGGNLRILYGNGAGGFTAGAPISVPWALGVMTGDFNADSRTDIVSDACVLLNQGSGGAAAMAAPARAGTPASVDFAISPNPLHERGTVRFNLAQEGRTWVHVYDLAGRRVSTLADGVWLSSGSHVLAFERGADLKAGIYLVRIVTGDTRIGGSFIVVDR